MGMIYIRFEVSKNDGQRSNDGMLKRLFEKTVVGI